MAVRPNYISHSIIATILKCLLNVTKMTQAILKTLMLGQGLLPKQLRQTGW